MLSVLINTKNEEVNIKGCIESAATIASEIVVVDMQSHDNTQKIARELGSVVISCPDFGYVEPARQLGVSACKYTWILILDADERLTEQALSAVRKIIEIDEVDLAWIPRLNYFYGEPVLHTGWGPNQDKQLRLFKKNIIEFSTKIHSTPLMSKGAKVSTLNVSNKEYIIHENYKSRSHFIEKLNRYTDIQAIDFGGNRNKSFSGFHFFYYPLKEFLLRFIYLKGYKDGPLGFELSLSMAFYKLMLCAKYNEFIEKSKP